MTHQQPITQPSTAIHEPYVLDQIRRAFINHKFLITAFVSVLLLSTIFDTVNYFGPQYIGNNYYPAHCAEVGFLLLLMLLGTYLQVNNTQHVSFQMVKEVFYFYLMMGTLVFLTNAAQLTPLKPIDAWIIKIESAFRIDLTQMIAWTVQHPSLQDKLMLIYSSLNYQLTALPLLMIALKQWTKLREYYFLMLVSAFIGFCFYYFFPTTAPANNLFSPYFPEEARATGVKFYQIHHYLTPTTNAGGLVALPSFHTIWAFWCLFLIYEQKILFFLLLPINICLVASCVLLGWHYPLDLLGSALVICVSYCLLGWTRMR